ncbi:MAG: peptidoglycan-binding domain-containing protein [Saprospiraceae bacterium]
MSFYNTLNQLLPIDTNVAPLQLGAKSFDIKWLRQGLYEMGFDKRLLWDSATPDGAYDDILAAALKSFAERNQLPSDGKTLTPELVKKLAARYELLQSIEMLHRAILLEETETLYDPTDLEKEGTKAVDRMLRELGFVQPNVNDALTEFAQLENHPFDGKVLNMDLAKGLRGCLLYFYGEHFLDLPWFENLKTGTLTKDTGKEVTITDGTLKGTFKKFRAGYYTVGNQTIKDFLQTNRDDVRSLNVSDAAISTMIAVSENEGNLDAINTWDNAFLSIGVFQWTLGTGSDPGELAALLKKIKYMQPQAFETYFAQYGIDVDDKATGTTTGYLLFRGNRVVKPEDKDLFRPPHRLFRFWLAAQDPKIKAVQIEHALSRLNNFYWNPRLAINGLLLAQIVTSQYGVALILDNHVNRPSYVKPCIEKALQAARLDKPIQTWNTEDELKLIHEYLKIREIYGSSPMTDARKRALVTKRYLDQGIISADRNSFRFLATGERSLDTYNTPSFPQPPVGYNPDDYPLITKGRKIMTNA